MQEPPGSDQGSGGQNRMGKIGNKMREPSPAQEGRHSQTPPGATWGAKNKSSEHLPKCNGTGPVSGWHCKTWDITYTHIHSEIQIHQMFVSQEPNQSWVMRIPILCHEADRKTIRALGTAPIMNLGMGPLQQFDEYWRLTRSTTCPWLWNFDPNPYVHTFHTAAFQETVALQRSPSCSSVSSWRQHHPHQGPSQERTRGPLVSDLSWPVLSHMVIYGNYMSPC